MENNYKKMRLEDFIMFWGFIIFIFGAIGIVLIGILDGINIFIIYGCVVLIIGIITLLYIAIADKIKG